MHGYTVAVDLLLEARNRKANAIYHCYCLHDWFGSKATVNGVHSHGRVEILNVSCRIFNNYSLRRR